MMQQAIRSFVRLAGRHDHFRRWRSTWVHLDHYKVKWNPMELLVENDQTIRQLKFELVQSDVVASKLGASRLSVYESQGGRELALSDKTPERTRDNPLWISTELTEEEEFARQQAEFARQREEDMKAKGLEVANALLNSELEEVPIPDHLEDELKPDPIYVLKDTPDFDGEVVDIFVRKSMKELWELVDKTVKSKPRKQPVCVVGSPGIGKSTTFLFFMRQLLLKGKTVTYLHRTIAKESFFFQMVPDPKGGDPVINVFPESADFSILPTMDDPEAYLLLDCGKTKDSCDWSESIRAKLVINASPDSSHWGGNEFAKQRIVGRATDGGVFLYAPSYTLSELLVVVPLIDKEATTESIKEDFFFFGGSLRQYISSNQDKDDFKDKQSHDLEALMSLSHYEEIIAGEVGVDFKSPNPTSAVVSVEPDPSCTEKRKYRKPQSQALSRFVLLEAAKLMERKLFSLAKEDRPDNWKYMELLLKAQLTKEKPREYTIRPCVGMKSPEWTNTREVTLGGCIDEKEVMDMFKKSASLSSGETNTLLYSRDENHKLFDMVYRDTDDTFHAFNATIQGKNRKKLPTNFSAIVKEWIDGLDLANHPNRKVHLYYATINDWNEFATSPAEPELPTVTGIDNIQDRFKVFHCKVTKSADHIRES
jgi:hypothetical protein